MTCAANGEKCALYFSLSFLLAVVLLLLFIICRLSRKRTGHYRPPAVRSMRGVWTTPKGLGLLRHSPTLDDSTASPLYGFDRGGVGGGTGEGTGSLSRQSTLSRPSPFQQYASIQQRPASGAVAAPAPAHAPVPIQATVPVASAYPYSSYGDGGSGGLAAGSSVLRPAVMHERSDDVDFAMRPVQEQQQQRLLQPPSWATVSNGRHGHSVPRQYFDNVYRR